MRKDLVADEYFIVCGYWNTKDEDGLSMVIITRDIKEAEDELKKIQDSHASEYVRFVGAPEVMESNARVYEVRDQKEEGGYAKFYVLPCQLKV